MMYNDFLAKESGFSKKHQNPSRYILQPRSGSCYFGFFWWNPVQLSFGVVVPEFSGLMLESSILNPKP